MSGEREMRKIPECQERESSSPNVRPRRVADPNVGNKRDDLQHTRMSGEPEMQTTNGALNVSARPVMILPIGSGRGDTSWCCCCGSVFPGGPPKHTSLQNPKNIEKAGQLVLV